MTRGRSHLQQWRWQLRALAIVGAVAALGVIFHLIVRQMQSDNSRIMPEIANAGWVLLFPLAGSMLYLLYALVRHGLPARRDRSRAHRAAYVLVSVLVHAVATLAACTAILVSHPDFPLGPSLQVSETSPNGARIAYAYKDFGCLFKLYVREAGTSELRKVDTVSPAQCPSSVRLKWSADSERVSLTAPDGTALVDGPGLNLYLGPH